MRAGGGRTKSRSSLRGHPKGRAEKPRAQHPALKPATDRAGSGSKGPDPRRPAVNRPRAKKATAVAVALSTSAKHCIPPKKKKHHRLEAFVPLQRHLYGEEKVYLPCPGSKQ